MVQKNAHPIPNATIRQAITTGDIHYKFHNDTIARQLFEVISRSNHIPTSFFKELSPILFLFERHRSGQRTKRVTTNSTDVLSNNQCNIRTKTNDGYLIGDFLLMSAEALRNPLLVLVEVLYEMDHPRKNQGSSIIPEWLTVLLEACNSALDAIMGLFTITGYNFIKYAAVKALKSIGHLLNNEMDCLTKQPTLADLATSMLKFKNVVPSAALGANRRDSVHYNRHRHPAELQRARPFLPMGSFIQQSSATGINTVKYAQVLYGGQPLLINIINNRLYPSNNNQTLKQIHFDEQTDTLYFESEQPEKLPYFILNGADFIELYGHHYKLNYNLKTKAPEIEIERHHSNNRFVPVYQEPLSKTWHLSIYNGHSVFTNIEKIMLTNLRAQQKSNVIYQDFMNSDPFHYGTGKLWFAKRKQTHKKYQYGPYIEIGGRLFKVRQYKENGQLRYEIHNPNRFGGQGYPVEWDGRRWVLERATSIHVSPEVYKMITRKRWQYGDQVDLRTLSPADQFGLKWNHKDQAFLKIHFRYTPINRVNLITHRVNINLFNIVSMPSCPRINLQFKNNTFMIEPIRQRLQRLTSKTFNYQPLTTLDWIKKIRWLNQTQIRTLLDSYDFPTTGFFSQHAFLIDLEQTGNIPAWANQFKKNNQLLSVNSSGKVPETVSVFSTDHPVSKKVLKLIPLNSDSQSKQSDNLFLDINQPTNVVKKYKDELFPKQIANLSHYIEQETRRFHHYFGESAAEPFIDNIGHHYLILYSIPGKAINNIASLPSNAPERWVDMIEKLTILDLSHGDLHIDDLTWDDMDNSFYPINSRLIISKHYHHHLINGAISNQLERRQARTIFEKIKKKVGNFTRI